MSDNTCAAPVSGTDDSHPLAGGYLDEDSLSRVLRIAGELAQQVEANRAAARQVRDQAVAVLRSQRENGVFDIGTNRAEEGDVHGSDLEAAAVTAAALLSDSRANADNENNGVGEEVLLSTQLNGHRLRSTVSTIPPDEHRRLLEENAALMAENAGLSALVRDHEQTLETIMQKFRVHTNSILQERAEYRRSMEAKLDQERAKADSTREENAHLREMIDKMASILRTASDAAQDLDTEMLVEQLSAENDALRELLSISDCNGRLNLKMGTETILEERKAPNASPKFGSGIFIAKSLSSQEAVWAR